LSEILERLKKFKEKDTSKPQNESGLSQEMKDYIVKLIQNPIVKEMWGYPNMQEFIRDAVRKLIHEIDETILKIEKEKS
jgi:Arc/MetJ-type ribon-helix-helix transcriptional regulator